MASLWKMGTFILMKINVDRPLDSLVREYNAICMGLYCLLLLEKASKFRGKNEQKVTSFKLMTVSWNKLKSLFAHLKQIIIIIIICSLDFILSNLSDLYPTFLMVIWVHYWKHTILREHTELLVIDLFTKI